MTHAEILLEDFEAEAEGTRKVLERVPVSLAAFKPHDKSTPLGKLALHLATLPSFGTAILSADKMDLTTAKFPSLTFESTEQVVAGFDQNSADLRAKLAAISDHDLEGHWVLAMGDKVMFDAPKVKMFRTMCLSHLVHHRAQLGVYLRLNDIPVPGLYGPSADDRLGF